MKNSSHKNPDIIFDIKQTKLRPWLKIVNYEKKGNFLMLDIAATLHRSNPIISKLLEISAHDLEFGKNNASTTVYRAHEGVADFIQETIKTDLEHVFKIKVAFLK